VKVDVLNRRRLVDLSHPIEPGMTTYPGLPGPAVSDHLSREDSRPRYASGTTFQIARIEMVANTGTYVDAPFHRFAEGSDVGKLPLSRVADLEGILVPFQLVPHTLSSPLGERVGTALVEAGSGRAVGPEHLARLELSGKAVLIRTGWDIHWRTPRYGDGHPFVTRAAAEALVEAGPALVGIDSVNIDDTADGSRPAHTLLLAAGIPIVEHLCNLAALPPSGFRFSAAPAPFHGVGSFPVRAYAVIEEGDEQD
jgi:kynurenine formamidase